MRAARRPPYAAARSRVDLAFPYHPHVTIAHHLADAQLDQAFDELADFECEFDVDDFHLYVHDDERGLDAHALLRPAAGYLTDDGRAVVDRVKGRVAEAAAAPPRVDHAVRTQEHYGATKASQQAGAVTYFGFLSVFPVLALAFFVVGWVAKVFPDAQDTLVDGDRADVPRADRRRATTRSSSSDIENSAATVGLIGLVGAPLRRARLALGAARRPDHGLRAARARSSRTS